MGAPVHTQNDRPCSAVLGKGGSEEGSLVPGCQDSARRGRQGGERQEEGSGDASQTPERRLGLVTHTDDGLPTAQGWARGRAKTEGNRRTPRREGVNERTEGEGKREKCKPSWVWEGWLEDLGFGTNCPGARGGRPAFTLRWSALWGTSSTDQERVGPPPLAQGMPRCPGCDMNQTWHEADLHIC